MPPGPWTREQLLGLCATNPEQVVDLIFALLARVEQLTQRVQELERQVNQNSLSPIIENRLLCTFDASGERQLKSSPPNIGVIDQSGK